MKNIKKLFFALTAILCLQQPCHAGFMDTLSSYGSSALQWIQQNPRITGLFATIFTVQTVYSYRQSKTITKQNNAVQKKDGIIAAQAKTIREQDKAVKERDEFIEEQENTMKKQYEASQEYLKTIKNLQDEISKLQEDDIHPGSDWAGDFFLSNKERSAQYEREERQQRINEAWDSRPKQTVGEQYANGYIKFRNNLHPAIQALTPTSAPFSN